MVPPEAGRKPASESTDPVTDNVTLISGVASRYATALLDLSEEQGSVAEVEKALATFEKLLQDSEDLSRLVTSPVFSADEQVKALDAVLPKAGIAGLAGNFIKLAARNRRLFAVPSMIAAFRAAPAHRGQVCRDGLWAWSRHPNYFFEWLHWFAYVLLAASGDAWAWSLLGPVVMLAFLYRVSGIPWTEANALRSRPEAYARYQREVSPFIPWPPRRGDS